MSANVNVGNLAGQNGGTYISDTAAYTPTSPVDAWFGIYCIADAVFTLLTDSQIENIPNDLELTAGQAIYGHFAAITLASGSVIAYNK
ncbi:MAG: hypothetical protein DRQ98_11510 [Gammaproteobacteria bacterium]|nr:MAG: hypothetical protein DRQ98_11510 [Gammaproteobacteria bacterium]